MTIATPAPPRSEAELIARADAMAGRTLGWVAAQHLVAVPPDLRRAKGWIGQLLELVLGATASSRALPDFPHLGVELKTIPVDARGRPSEGTFVCTARLAPDAIGAWGDSWVRAKLSRVLWVPIVGAGPPAGRTVGTGVLWTPNPSEQAQLRADWDELAALVAEGQLWQIDGRRGKVLQLRPKGADRHSAAWALDEGGDWVKETPRGFYLRPAFTGAILTRNLLSLED